MDLELRALKCGLSLLLMVLGSSTSSLSISAQEADFQFVEVAAESGISEFVSAAGVGASVAAADYDDDGDIDIFAPNTDGVPDQLYRNLGAGQFEEIAASVGLASVEQSRAALWFDFDGDHRLDLFVAGDCFEKEEECFEQSTIRLYRQTDEGAFDDVTLQAGFVDDMITEARQRRGGLTAGDFNNDGYLDLLVPIWLGEIRVFLNNGDGTFTDISLASGMGGEIRTWWQHVMHDWNQDGWLDIYTAIDFGEDRLWINQRNNTFLNVAREADVHNFFNGMGIAPGDYDNDGDIDIYVTNITIHVKHNVLHRNDSAGSNLQFAEVSEESGVAFAGWAWGCTFFDADNDGYLDLAVTNGYKDRLNYETDPSRLFRNTGTTPVYFEDVSDAVGFNDTLLGFSLVALDFDRDGRLDLLQTTQALNDDPSRLRLLRNQPGAGVEQNNFLVIRPRMEGPNHWAIGAVVRARAGELSMTRLITAGTSFMGQEPAEAHFGLGTADRVDEVIIEWPDGTESVLRNVEANQILTVEDTLPMPEEGEEGMEYEPEQDGENEGEPIEELEAEGEEHGESENDTEEEGESNPSGGLRSVYGPQALVASSVSGLRDIRNFRDSMLRTTRAGGALTAMYYSRETEEVLKSFLESRKIR